MKLTFTTCYVEVDQQNRLFNSKSISYVMSCFSFKKKQNFFVFSYITCDYMRQLNVKIRYNEQYFLFYIYICMQI